MCDASVVAPRSVPNKTSSGKNDSLVLLDSKVVK
jgi:hypothetical protein